MENIWNKAIISSQVSVAHVVQMRAVFWTFTPCSNLYSDVSESCTVFVFRITELLHTDAEVMEWKRTCLLYRKHPV